jgi:hypothetical protein
VLDDPLLPRVVSVNPLNGAVDVALDSTITVKFDEELDPATIFRDNVTAWMFYPDPIEVNDIHNLPINGSIGYDAQTFTLTFTPDPGELEYNNGYTVTVSSYITDIAGNPIDGNSNSIADPVPSDDYKWVFTTVAVITDPGSNQVEVPLDTVINATFSGNTSLLTIMNSEINVKGPDGIEVPGFNSYDNKTLTVTFNPTENLKKGIIYTVIFDVHVYPKPDSTMIYANYTMTWEFSTGSISSSEDDEDELDTNALLIWLIYVIVIIIILVVIFVIFKRRRAQPEKPEPSRDEYLYEEDWSAEVRKPVRKVTKKKKRKRPREDDEIEWDDDGGEEDSWKPPVVEWEEIETKPEPTPIDQVIPPKKHRKSKKVKSKSRNMRVSKKSKRKQ